MNQTLDAFAEGLQAIFFLFYSRTTASLHQQYMPSDPEQLTANTRQKTVKTKTPD
jgi:hypothetical protein